MARAKRELTKDETVKENTIVVRRIMRREQLSRSTWFCRYSFEILLDGKQIVKLDSPDGRDDYWMKEAIYNGLNLVRDSIRNH